MKSINLILILSLVFLSIYSAGASPYTVTGKVINKQTGEPIPGATVRVTNSNRSTYTSSKGIFRLPFLEGDLKIKISSIGYQSEIANASEIITDTLLISLKPASVQLKGVSVTADIEPNEIIKRAIAKKDENLKKLKTFKGELYSKFVIELGGSIFAKTSSSGSSITLAGALGETVEGKYQAFILETFSRVYADYDNKKRRTEIIQRRQTSNLKPQDNLLTIGNFINFYDESIKFINADMVTPLSRKALDYYNFKILKKALLDDRYIYVLSVKPSSKLFPAFEGVIKIVEGTYNLVEVDLKPSDETAITFISDLHINQKFQEVQKDLWHPTFLEITGKAAVDVIKSFADVKMDIKATSIYSDIEVNGTLPDTIFNEIDSRTTKVAPDADSAKPEFWEKNAMREITEKEQKLYQKVDSLVAKSDTNQIKASKFNYDIFTPLIDFNRVGSLSIGLKPSLYLYGFNLETSGGYSFGLQKPLGEAKLSYNIYSTNHFSISMNTSAFSKLETMSPDNSYPRLVNTAFAALFHYDYYDYFKTDGFNAGFNSYVYGIQLWGNAEFTRQFSLKKNTNRSIFVNDYWRENPECEEGSYRTANIGININYIDYLLRNTGIRSSFKLFGLYGEKENGSNPFRMLWGETYFSLPTFETGYAPMQLELMGKIGISDKNVPVQYQYRMRTNIFFIGKFGNFLTAPIAKYGGTEYVELHGKYNLTDIWWRAIGLPLYEGRGLDLIVAASTGRYLNNASSFYKSYYPNYYSEVGFGLARVPTFISNVIYLGADFRWGMGPVANKRFGWAVTAVLPF